MLFKALIFAFLALAVVEGKRRCYACDNESKCVRPKIVTCGENITGCFTATSDQYPYFVKGCADDGNGN